MSNHPNQGTNAPASLIAMGNPRKKVIILAMGSSRSDFDALQLVENRPDLLIDAELWGINYMGAIKRLDRIIHVDPVHPFLGHAPVKDMCDFALKDGIPFYTSHPHPHYINHVVYPFDKVVQALGIHYFNNSVAYALALAIAEGYTDIGLFGADFSYPNAHMSESGRACCEFLIGIGTQRGIRFAIAANSTLMDLYCQQQPYGFFKDPLLPPANGGKLMSATEIMEHVARVRDAGRIVRPQVFAYEVKTVVPAALQPFNAVVAEHAQAPAWLDRATPPTILADGSGQPQQEHLTGVAHVARDALHVPTRIG